MLCVFWAIVGAVLGYIFARIQAMRELSRLEQTGELKYHETLKVL
jgi:hypothetical protein